MDELNSQEPSKQKKEDNSKNKVQHDILNLIKKSRFGLNFSQIAEELKIGRNTVKLNAYTLEEDGKILIKQIGRSKICYFHKFFDLNATYRPFIYDFFNQLLDSFEVTMKSYSPNAEELAKQISKEMGKNLDLPPFEFLKLGQISNSEKISLDDIANTLLQFFELFEALNLCYQAEMTPKEFDFSRIIRLQLFTDEVGRSAYFYHVCAGFFESKLNKFYNSKIQLDVLEYRKDNSCCYFRLERLD